MRNLGFARSRVLPGFFVGAMICVMAAAQDTPQKSSPVQVRLSEGVSKANLIKSPAPVYPSPDLNVSGTVVVFVTVGKDGSVERARIVSGHPMLVGAAMDAVKQWKYKPYLLNGQPVEVETQVTVKFERPKDTK
jgi:protein TonB